MKTAKTFGRRYPWDAWLGQPETVLIRGIHYDIEPSSMAQLVYRALRRFGLAGRRSVHVEGSNVRITFKK